MVVVVAAVVVVVDKPEVVSGRTGTAGAEVRRNKKLAEWDCAKCSTFGRGGNPSTFVLSNACRYVLRNLALGAGRVDPVLGAHLGPLGGQPPQVNPSYDFL